MPRDDNFLVNLTDISKDSMSCERQANQQTVPTFRRTGFSSLTPFRMRFSLPLG